MCHISSGERSSIQNAEVLRTLGCGRNAPGLARGPVKSRLWKMNLDRTPTGVSRGSVVRDLENSFPNASQNFRWKFARKVFSSMNFTLVPESSRECEAAHTVNAYREHSSRASAPIERDFTIRIGCYFWQRQRLREKACECYGPIDGLGVHWDDLCPSCTHRGGVAQALDFRDENVHPRAIIVLAEILNTSTQSRSHVASARFRTDDRKLRVQNRAVGNHRYASRHFLVTNEKNNEFLTSRRLSSSDQISKEFPARATCLPTSMSRTTGI